MRRLVIILLAIAGLVAVGIAVNNSGSDSPIISSDGAPPAAADGDLASIGPVTLVSHAYTLTVTVPCTQGQGAPATAPVDCGRTIQTSEYPAGFTALANTNCNSITGINGFDVVGNGNPADCRTNGSGALQLSSLAVTASAGNPNNNSLPCQGVEFATVVIQGADGHTLAITIGASNNPNPPCNSGT